MVLSISHVRQTDGADNQIDMVTVQNKVLEERVLDMDQVLRAVVDHSRLRLACCCYPWHTVTSMIETVEHQ